MLLRTTFTAAKPVVAARLYATALGAYEARINGQRVSDAVLAPETTVAKSHILYQCHDATALIAEADNLLGAIVGDGWYASPLRWRIERYGFCPAPRPLPALLWIDYAARSRAWFVTCPDCTIAPSPHLTSAHMTSYER